MQDDQRHHYAIGSITLPFDAKSFVSQNMQFYI
jgi:hypothetical protein